MSPISRREFIVGAAVIGAAVVAPSLAGCDEQGRPWGLLVVAPQDFIGELGPFVAHKNNTGMPTRLYELQALIRNEPGRDDAERLKRAIFRATQDGPIRYVLLAGDATLVPVRYRRTALDPNLTTHPYDSWYTAADLYYANLYRRHTSSSSAISTDTSSGYSDWDADNDQSYNEHNWADDAVRNNPDLVDGCPDVAVGRIPAHDVNQLRTYLRKVITYETGSGVPEQVACLADRNYGVAEGLLDQMITASGLADRSRPIPLKLPVQRLSYAYPAGVTPPTGYSRAEVAGIETVAGRSPFLVYLGHGSTTSWGIGLSNTDVARYRNSSLPVVVSVGCSTGEWVPAAPDHIYPGESVPRYRGVDNLAHSITTNVAVGTFPITLTDMRSDGTSTSWERLSAADTQIALPRPGVYDLNRESPTFATSWLFNNDGGGIAFCGETTVAQNNWGRDFAAGFFSVWIGSGTVLGEMWLAAGRNYWKTYQASDNRIGAPRCYLTYMTLFGDPSLRIRTQRAAT